MGVEPIEFHSYIEHLLHLVINRKKIKKKKDPVDTRESRNSFDIGIHEFFRNKFSS